MSAVICSACRLPWDGAAAPHCPPCLAARWLVAPELVVEKHNPDTYPTLSDHYRSVMTRDFLENRRSYLEYAAAHAPAASLSWESDWTKKQGCRCCGCGSTANQRSDHA